MFNAGDKIELQIRPGHHCVSFYPSGLAIPHILARLRSLYPEIVEEAIRTPPYGSMHNGIDNWGYLFPGDTATVLFEAGGKLLVRLSRKIEGREYLLLNTYAAKLISDPDNDY